MNDNPYATPTVSSPLRPGDDQDSRRYQIGEEVVFWEKLRLLYNAILTVVTLACLWLRPQWMEQPYGLVTIIVFGAVGANLCYSAGTILGAYLAWVGFQNRSFSWFVFICGTLFAILLTVFAMFQTTF